MCNPIKEYISRILACKTLHSETGREEQGGWEEEVEEELGDEDRGREMDLSGVKDHGLVCMFGAVDGVAFSGIEVLIAGALHAAAASGPALSVSLSVCVPLSLCVSICLSVSLSLCLSGAVSGQLGNDSVRGNV